MDEDLKERVSKLLSSARPPKNQKAVGSCLTVGDRNIIAGGDVHIVVCERSTIHPAPGQRALPVSILIVAALCVVVATILKVSPFQSDTRSSLASMADRLRTADQRGDREAASDLLEQSAATLRTLNEARDAGRRTSHDCLLAAVHLSHGVESVSSGGRWSSMDRFNNTFSGCP